MIIKLLEFSVASEWEIYPPQVASSPPHSEMPT
jgi:hypothetical protein